MVMCTFDGGRDKVSLEYHVVSSIGDLVVDMAKVVSGNSFRCGFTSGCGQCKFMVDLSELVKVGSIGLIADIVIR